MARLLQTAAAWSGSSGLRLTMAGADLTATPGKWTLRVEGAVASQGVAGGPLTKPGGYVMSSHKVSRVVEPYAWVE